MNKIVLTRYLDKVVMIATDNYKEGYNWFWHYGRLEEVGEDYITILKDNGKEVVLDINEIKQIATSGNSS